MRSLGWALTTMTGVVIKMGYLETFPHTRRITCEDEGSGWGDAPRAKVW